MSPKTAGIGPDDDIGFNDPEKAKRFIRGLLLQEHGKASNAYTDGMIITAIQQGAAPGAQKSPAGPTVPSNVTPPQSGPAGPAVPSSITSPVPVANWSGPAAPTTNVVAPNVVQPISVPVPSIGDVLMSRQQQKRQEAEEARQEQARRIALFGDGLQGLYT